MALNLDVTLADVLADARLDDADRTLIHEVAVGHGIMEGAKVCELMSHVAFITRPRLVLAIDALCEE